MPEPQRRAPARTRSRRSLPAVAVLLAALLVALVGALTLRVGAAGAATASFTVVNSWNSGYEGRFTVTNDTSVQITSWRVEFDLPGGSTVTQSWSAQQASSGNHYAFTNAAWNGTLGPNASTTFGFVVTGSGRPSGCLVNGAACTGGGGPSPTASPTPSPTPSPTGPGGCSAQPVDPLATRQARNVLCYLYSQYGNHVISGQQESTWVSGPDYEMNYIHGISGRYPAIRGLDRGDAPDFGARALAWWNAGGIPMVGYHMGSPAQASDGYSGSRLRANISAALTAGTADNTRLRQRLDGLAAQLRIVQSGGGAVIFRPWHEAGGTWFWWSMEGGAQYVRLWQYTFDYLTRTQGLHNLVWLLPFNGEPDRAFAPSKAYYDLGGPDTYASNHGPLTSLFNAARGILGGTVPIALHENGPIPDPAQLQSSGTRWVLFNTWHTSWITDTSINPTSLIRSVYTSSYVITRDELPNLR